jgi:hypothetical protein
LRTAVPHFNEGDEFRDVCRSCFPAAAHQIRYCKKLQIKQKAIISKEPVHLLAKMLILPEERIAYNLIESSSK